MIILKEGTERSRNKEARDSNIMAARTVAQAIKTSLGPKGMDKMLMTSFGDVTITNDGATMLKEMDVQHPAAKMMVEIAETQDDEVGDGTTSVVVLAGELLGKAAELMDKKIHPTVIIDGYMDAQEQALKYLEEMAIKVNPRDKEMLEKVAVTAMASKLIAGHSGHIADLAVDAVLQIAEETGISPGTVRPALRALFPKKFVTQERDRSYKSKVPFTDIVSDLFTNVIRRD